MISGRWKSGLLFRGRISDGAQPLKRQNGVGVGGVIKMW